jgi:uncharacterized protein YdhG (YjbR/CyaY superfamily)
MEYKAPIAKTIDEYISHFPAPTQQLLQAIREIIHRAAPTATEAISYQMPTFKLNGNLIHFAAYEHHIGLYPFPSGIVAFEQELKRYATAKGSIRFPLNQPIPFDLIQKITEYRVREKSRSL